MGVLLDAPPITIPVPRLPIGLRISYALVHADNLTDRRPLDQECLMMTEMSVIASLPNWKSASLHTPPIATKVPVRYENDSEFQGL